MKRHLGTLSAIGSALIFGFTPIWGRLSYDGGSNGIMLTFFRAAFAIPVLFLILKQQGISLKISARECRDLLWIGPLGPALATVLLYSSYQYISTGIATVLHFSYPVLVTMISVIFWGVKFSKGKTSALICSFLGVLMFFQSGEHSGTMGIFLAFASSVAYTVYMIGIEKTSLKSMHHFKLTFYVCCMAMVVSFAAGIVTHSITFRLTPIAWVYTILVSIFASIGAVTLFQLSIQLIGASSTAILSTLEPITSVVLGALILGEKLSLQKGIGCILILASVVGVTYLQTRKSSTDESEY